MIVHHVKSKLQHYADVGLQRRQGHVVMFKEKVMKCYVKKYVELKGCVVNINV